jgi:hypothetical protein
MNVSLIIPPTLAEIAFIAILMGRSMEFILCAVRSVSDIFTFRRICRAIDRAKYYIG